METVLTFGTNETLGSNVLERQLPSDTDATQEILQRLESRLRRTPLPASTYRLQFHGQFPFSAAADAVSYLHDLGITHVYASPYLQACTGSTHGYDIVDHSRLNGELGSAADFDRFVAELRMRGMGHLLDVVPNHMGVGGDENPWWQDVLENGPSSHYAKFFDIDWQPLKTDLRNKVLLPVLGEQYGQVLENQQLQLYYETGAFHVRYWQRRFPIAPRSSIQVLSYRLEELERRLGTEHPQLLEYRSIVTGLSHLPPRDETTPEKLRERHRENEIAKRRLHRLVEESPPIRQFIEENITVFNGEPGNPRSFDLLDGLLQDQAYRLSYWRVASDEINYRRFFDQNQLAALCMEDPAVFDETHDRIFHLLNEGQLDGLRIDHADGLYAPADYLCQLQKRRYLQLCRREYDAWCETTSAAEGAVPTWDQVKQAGEKWFDEFRGRAPSPPRWPMYVVVEKILGQNEPLPSDWPVHGATGYEFLAQVNNLLVRSDSTRSLNGVYARFIGKRIDFEELVYQSKRLIMKVAMAGELNMLGHQLDRISEKDRRSCDFTLNGLTHAIREIVASFPVYRTYTTAAGVMERDCQYIEQAVERAKQRNPAVNASVFDFVRDVLLLRLPGMDSGPETIPEAAVEGNAVARRISRAEVLRFIGRFQQYTGPMMAKAVEDTAFYIFNRLISLNEVGGDPRRVGITVEDFHEFNRRRQATHPWALSATATHDTKRGEDTRARINVLSEIPQRWKDHLQRWSRWNKRKKTLIDGQLAPSRNDEYLLYQTILGTWPWASPRGEELRAYVERVQQYMIKAMREAKLHTSWMAPHAGYEQATSEFLEAILGDEPQTAFRMDFEPFAQDVARVGVWNSLSQTLLKLTSPGVPDTYQGTELWDLSLVDPDNRRPVDYAIRRQWLTDIQHRSADTQQRAALIDELIADTSDGRIKLFLVMHALHLRRQFPELFTEGDYHPLEVSGDGQSHGCAFVRRHGDEHALIVVPRWTVSLPIPVGSPPTGSEAWGDTHLILPPGIAADEWRDVFTGGRHVPAGGTLRFADLLQRFPVALLRGGKTPTGKPEISRPTS